MSRLLAPVLIILGSALFFAGQWVALDIYMNTKLGRISHNMAQFIYHLHSGDTLIKLSNREENVFILRTAAGRVVSTENVTGPLSPDKFITGSYGKDGDSAYAYTKRPSFSEYMNTFFEKPFSLGIALSGLFIFITGLVLLPREGRREEVEVSETGPEESPTELKELMNKLKALRTTLALNEVIPEDTLSETKKLLDDIIKMEGKL